MKETGGAMHKTIQIPVTSVDDPYGDFFSIAYDNEWTDGLPVIPPTVKRVDQFLATVDRDPDEIVAVIPPREGPASVRSIAANAVMAGCLPEYFPVVLAAVEAISDPRFALKPLITGLRPETPFLVINGPIRHDINLNCGRSCLGPGWRANATIGRAIRLILINIGGFTPKGFSRSCFASPLQYTFCAGEHEEEFPWDPLHVELGFRREQNVVSIFRVTSYIGCLAPLDWDQSPTGLLEHTALSMVSLGNTALYAGSFSCLVLFNPERAKMLNSAGLSKHQVKEMLYEYALLPTSYFRKTVVDVMHKKGRVKGDKVSMVDSPDNIYIAVMGGAGIHTVFLPGFSHEQLPYAPISKVIAVRQTGGCNHA